MAVDTYIVGNDGNVTIAIGGTTQTVIKVNTFAATLTRSIHNVTGFGDTGGRRRLGMLDVTGSINGFLGVDSTNTGNTAVSVLFVNAQDGILTNVTNSPPVVTLSLYGGTTAAKIVSTALLHSFAFNSNKTGDATIACQFENSSGSAPVVTWLV